MKITVNQLKQLIKEEIENNSQINQLKQEVIQLATNFFDGDVDESLIDVDISSILNTRKPKFGARFANDGAVSTIATITIQGIPDPDMRATGNSEIVALQRLTRVIKQLISNSKNSVTYNWSDQDSTHTSY